MLSCQSWQVRQLIARRALKLSAAIAVALSMCFASGAAAEAHAGNDQSSGVAVSRSLTGINVLGWGLSSPDAIAEVGAHIWIANSMAGTVTELAETTGTFVRTISAQQLDISNPGSIVSNGSDVWVETPSNVSELNASTAALVKITHVATNVEGPGYMAADGTHVWVADYETNSVAEFNESSSGALVKIVRGKSYGIDCPAYIATEGGNVWVASTCGRVNLTEFSGSTLTVERVLRGNGGGLIAADSGHIWVANPLELIEVNAATGATERIFGPGSEGLHAGAFRPVPIGHPRRSARLGRLLLWRDGDRRVDRQGREHSALGETRWEMFSRASSWDQQSGSSTTWEMPLPRSTALRGRSKAC